MTKTMGEKKRFFTVVSSSFGTNKAGRYISIEPMEAGRKAGRQIFRDADKKRSSSRSNNIVFVQMIEKTRFNKVAHPKDRYYYKVTRVKIPEDKRKKYKFSAGNEFSPMYDYKVEEVKFEDFPADHRGGAATTADHRKLFGGSADDEFDFSA